MDLDSSLDHPAGTPAGRRARGLLGAAHPGPAVAVTLVAALLTVPEDLGTAGVLLVVLAVLTGQLSIGWSNDLVDLERDRRVGRTDKPLATAAVDPGTVRLACVLAVVATVPLSLACGWWAGLVNLGCTACGWAYNLGLKATVWSWVPYALAFGGLPVFVSLAAGATPLWWTAAAGALLGVGAHLVNALPDLADDEATGVRGLPHRLGAGATRAGAVLVLLGATVVLSLQAEAFDGVVRWLPLAVAAGLSVVALRGRGRTPFRAAIALALVDVVVLAVAR